MNWIKEYFRQPRKMYYSIVIMMTVVACLMTVTFSYYVDESTNNTRLVSIAKVDNFIISDALNDDVLHISPGEEANFTLYVTSNNDFDSMYKLYYKCVNTLVSVKTSSIVKNQIDGYGSHKYNITVINNSNNEQEVKFGVVNGYLNKTLELDNDMYEIN